MIWATSLICGTMAHTPRLTVLRLGRVGWSVAETLQRALVATRQTSALALREHGETDSIGVGGPAAAHADDVLLLCEHPPVYTTGRRVQVRGDTRTHAIHCRTEHLERIYCAFDLSRVLVCRALIYVHTFDIQSGPFWWSVYPVIHSNIVRTH